MFSISYSGISNVLLLFSLCLCSSTSSLGVRAAEGTSVTPGPAKSLPVTTTPVSLDASLETVHSSFSGLTANSAVTQTVNGAPTVVPVWFCGPSETAKACKSCPTSTQPMPSGITVSPPGCNSGFNAIFLVPLVPIPFLIGAPIPPPEGLPTLSIGDDGKPTKKDDKDEAPRTQTPPSLSISLPTSSTISSSDPFSAIGSCTTPSIKAADLATPSVVQPPPTFVPVPNPNPEKSPSTKTAPLPILPINNADPAHPTAFMSCGPYTDNPYYNGGFYQFGDSFSRVDGLDAIGQFCDEQIKKKRVVGAAGIHPMDDHSLTAVPLVVQTYDSKGGSGKIMIRMQADVDSKNGDVKCPGEFDLYSFAANSESSVRAQCRQFLGQTIDYCDIDKARSSTDTSWKQGGTFFTNCFYFTVVLSPAGGDGQVTPK